MKQPTLREVRLFGFPIYRELIESEYITARFMGIRLKKRENVEAIANRVDQSIHMIIREKTGACSWAAEDPSVYFAFRQLGVLDHLKARRGKQA